MIKVEYNPACDRVQVTVGIGGTCVLDKEEVYQLIDDLNRLVPRNTIKPCAEYYDSSGFYAISSIDDALQLINKLNDKNKHLQKECVPNWEIKGLVEHQFKRANNTLDNIEVVLTVLLVAFAVFLATYLAWVLQ